jgi:Chaperone of endosialidase
VRNAAFVGSFSVYFSTPFQGRDQAMEQASEAIYSLKPVSFRYKTQIEPTPPLSFGLIAEDVEAINADLVLRGKDGKASTVRYEAVNAMLLNEFLKEHKKCRNWRREWQPLPRSLKSSSATPENERARRDQSGPPTHRQ